MEENVKHIHLQRSSLYGFGFSIIGGTGSDLPPVICDIVENSPAYHCDEVRLLKARKKMFSTSTPLFVFVISHLSNKT